MTSPNPSPTTAFSPVPPASPATVSSKTDRLTSREASAARRNALRAFYKLSAEPASSPTPPTTASSHTIPPAPDSPAVASPVSPATPLESVPEGSAMQGAENQNDPSAIVAGLYAAYEKYVAELPPPHEDAAAEAGGAVAPLAETKKTAVNGVYVQPIDTFVRDLVAHHDLKMLLRIENELVAEIRSLDSEQKALVYNNYAKLTAAGTALAGVSREPARGPDAAGGEAEAGEEDEETGKELSKLVGKSVRDKIEQVVKGLGEIRAQALEVAGPKSESEPEPEPEESPLVKTAKWLVRVPTDLPRAVAAAVARASNDPERAKLLAKAAAVKARALTAIDHLDSNSGPGLQFSFDKSELQELREKIEGISIS